MDAQVVGVSVDHVPALKAWAESLGGIDFPLASDFWPHGEAARAWGVLRENDGHTERAVFVVDRKGIVRFADVLDIDTQPSNEDLFAVLKDLEPHLALRSRVQDMSAKRQAEAGAEEEPAEEAEEPADDELAIGEAEELELEEPEDAEEPALLMYCTPWCPDCKQAREWLDAHDIPYREVDVSRDLGARTRAAGYNEGRLHTPTFELEGDICVDFKPDRLSELLGMSK